MPGLAPVDGSHQRTKPRTGHTSHRIISPKYSFLLNKSLKKDPSSRVRLLGFRVYKKIADRRFFYYITYGLPLMKSWHDVRYKRLENLMIPRTLHANVRQQ